MIDSEKILALAAEELADANTKHPPTFNSMHEAYAVIKEEVEEMNSDMEYMKHHFEVAWNLVKKDGDCTDCIERTKQFAISAVQEAIQVIAMCDKALNSTEK